MDLVLHVNQKSGRGEGVQNPENFADVLYVWPLMALSQQHTSTDNDVTANMTSAIQGGGEGSLKSKVRDIV